MKVLLTGAAGQLGQALVASVPPEVDLIATSRAELDLANPACRNAVASFQPDWVINAGAYTGVDLAESNGILPSGERGHPGLREALADGQGRLPAEHGFRLQRIAGIHTGSTNNGILSASTDRPKRRRGSR